MRLTEIEQQAIQRDMSAGIPPRELREKHKLSASQMRYYSSKYNYLQAQEPQGEPQTEPPTVEDAIAVGEKITYPPQPTKTTEIEEFGCPMCEGLFPKQYANCPHCGVKLEW